MKFVSWLSFGGIGLTEPSNLVCFLLYAFSCVFVRLDLSHGNIFPLLLLVLIACKLHLSLIVRILLVYGILDLCGFLVVGTCVPVFRVS